MKKVKLKLIDLPTAKLAYELGFNQGCENFFQVNEKTFGVIENDSVPYYFPEGCSTYQRPSQDLLYTWLRDNYDIFLWFGQLDKPDQYHVEDIVQGDLIIGGVEEGSQTYEEALEKGLVETLRILINKK